MYVTVDPDFCDGCGVCVEIVPEVFALENEVAVVKVDTVPEQHEPAVREAAETCPAEAIDLLADVLKEA